MIVLDKLSVGQVKFIPVQPELTGELSDTIFRKCCFCEKTCQIFAEQSYLIQKLSGPGNFYCSFCLRHNFQNKNSRDVLILSFRSIIGYFYFQNYLHSSDKNKFWISEIEDFISVHEQAGLVNPVFLYNPDTMLWFIDFAKIGRSKKKIPVECVLTTIVSILTSFNLSTTITDLSMSALFLKYKDAIMNFYDKRHRPENKRMLIPTLTGCGVQEPKVFSFERTRNFVYEDLEIKK